MTEEEGPSPEALRDIDRRRSIILVTCAMALVVLATAGYFGAPPSAVVVIAVIILISVKKAAVSFFALGRKRAELFVALDSASSATQALGDRD